MAEAEAAINMVPYDGLSHAGLAAYLANAGRLDEALEWALWAVRHDPHGPAFYRSNLAWVHYLAGRYDQALAALRDGGFDFPQLLAAVYVRLGRNEKAKATIAQVLKDNLRDSVAVEAFWPLKEPFKQAWLHDLRQAGLPNE